MIEINVYANGYLIDGHAPPSICDQVSMTGWQFNNLCGDLNIIEDYYYSTIPNKQSLEGLSFGRCEWSPLVVIFIDNFYDTVKYWIESTYPKYVKVNDYRNEDYGIGSNVKYFKPTKEYYKQVKEFKDLENEN